MTNEKWKMIYGNLNLKSSGRNADDRQTGMSALLWNLVDHNIVVAASLLKHFLKVLLIDRLI